MSRIIIAVATLLLVGCAAAGATHNVDFASLSSRLFVEAPDGSLVKPLGGQVVGIAGINIGSESIGIAPGTHWVRTSCPAGSDGIQATHGQSVQHEFVIGKAYVLRCRDGYPEIETLGHMTNSSFKPTRSARPN
jgi:hypothetical protein